MSEPVSADDERAYATHYGAIDPRLELLTKRTDEKWIYCHEHFDERYVSGSEFYQDFLIPIGLRYVAGTKLEGRRGLTPILGIHRLKAQKPFGAHDQPWLDRIQPHFERAAHLHLELLRLDIQASVGQRALDALGHGVVVVDERGRIMLANRAGDAWLSDVSSRRDAAERTGPARLPFPARLHELILAATRGRDGTRTGGAVAFHRDGAASPDHVLVVPLRSDTTLVAARDRPMALVVVAVPTISVPPEVETLQALFGLTPAEARIARALAGGKSVEEYARSANVSANTARTQLRLVLEKTETHRQADLVRVVLSLPQLPGTR